MGTFYGPSINPDEIYHWKYKRKFRKNGHWVYVYDDDSMSEAGSVEIINKGRKKIQKLLGRLW